MTGRPNSSRILSLARLPSTVRHLQLPLYRREVTNLRVTAWKRQLFRRKAEDPVTSARVLARCSNRGVVCGVPRLNLRVGGTIASHNEFFLANSLLSTFHSRSCSCTTTTIEWLVSLFVAFCVVISDVHILHPTLLARYYCSVHLLARCGGWLLSFCATTSRPGTIDEGASFDAIPGRVSPERASERATEWIVVCR